MPRKSTTLKRNTTPSTLTENLLREIKKAIRAKPSVYLVLTPAQIKISLEL